MEKDTSSMLDGYEALPRFKRTCCLLCKHFYGTEKGTCKAYPNGIPDKFAVRNKLGWIETHIDVEPDQVGDFTLQFSWL